NVFTNSATDAPLTLGALNDGGVPSDIILNNAATGSLALSAPANTVLNGTQATVFSGTLKLGAAQVLGAQPNITIFATGTLDGNGQTVGGVVRGTGAIANTLASTGAIWPGLATTFSNIPSVENMNGANLDLSAGRLKTIINNSTNSYETLTTSGTLTLGGTS